LLVRLRQDKGLDKISRRFNIDFELFKEHSGCKAGGMCRWSVSFVANVLQNYNIQNPDKMQIIFLRTVVFWIPAHGPSYQSLYPSVYRYKKSPHQR
jgi:hypothetical protein